MMEQEWKGMDGAIAFHLIDRHAEDWAHTGKMMREWREANESNELEQLRQRVAELEKELNEVRKAEREKCAKVCGDAAVALKEMISEAPHDTTNNFLKHRWSQSVNLAEAIRAMGDE